MNKLDYQEVIKHINILNVAYHTNIEMTKKLEMKLKQYALFVGIKIINENQI